MRCFDMKDLKQDTTLNHLIPARNGKFGIRIEA